jgi:hypothetical protein
VDTGKRRRDLSRSLGTLVHTLNYNRNIACPLPFDLRVHVEHVRRSSSGIQTPSRKGRNPRLWPMSPTFAHQTCPICVTMRCYAAHPLAMTRATCSGNESERNHLREIYRCYRRGSVGRFEIVRQDAKQSYRQIRLCTAPCSSISGQEVLELGRNGSDSSNIGL